MEPHEFVSMAKASIYHAKRAKAAVANIPYGVGAWRYELDYGLNKAIDELEWVIRFYSGEATNRIGQKFGARCTQDGWCPDHAVYHNGKS